MAGVHPKIPRLSVRDSFDDEDLSDIDDEVFIRDGKHSILKLDDDCGVKRPLMAPRRKHKAHFPETTHLPYKTLFAPFCYTLIGFAIIVGIIIICVIAITQFSMPVNLFKTWFPKPKKTDINDLAPCTSLSSTLQWSRTFPKLTSEAPLRNNDVNGDNIEDIIVGFSIGLDKAENPEYICKLYFDNDPCMGGVLALDGRTGSTIWTHWTSHAVFSIDCGLDLNKDNVKDCVVAGRGGVLHAVSGKDGNLIWELPFRDPSMSAQQRYYDVYDARYIADVDNDEIGDVIASHTWQSEGSISEVVLLSGKTGKKLNSVDLSEKEKLFVAPQVLVHPDGETYLILVASGQEKDGGVYIIPQSKFIKGEFQLQKIYYGPGKGVSLPPLIIDVNSDGTEDIIVAVFNSTIVAFDGLTFKEIWNFTVPNSEVISIPVPGYYNDDDVPDFMVKHQIGPGFPVYYYTQATVLDGKTGKPIPESPMVDTMSAQISGLSVSVDGYGNDWFIHWSADCIGKEGAKDEYQYVLAPDPDADLCKLRFNSSLATTLLAFGQHVQPPGLSLYKSEDWKKLEYNNSIDPRKVAEEYANAHAIFSNSQDVGLGQKTEEKFPAEVESEQQQLNENNYMNKALDEMNEDEWRDNRWDNGGEIKERVQPEDEYDEDPYDDEEEERLLANRQMNEEIRLQRSEKGYGGRYINNDTNDVKNQLDPSMDYTNGQIKHANYYSSLPFNRSSNSDDYINVPDIDFVDNIKEAEAISKRQTEKINGIQRQPPTGILLPPLGKIKTNAVDLVFSTYWLPASPMPFVLLPPDLECVRDMEKRRPVILPEEREIIVKNCLEGRGVSYQPFLEAADKENSKISLGQMTIYRTRIECVCPEDTLPGQKCKGVRKLQSWPQHLGSTGSGYFEKMRA